MKATVSDRDRELTKMKAYRVAAEEMGVRQRVGPWVAAVCVWVFGTAVA